MDTNGYGILLPASYTKEYSPNVRFLLRMLNTATTLIHLQPSMSAENIVEHTQVVSTPDDVRLA
jgi:hypothetical protein